MTLCLTGGHDFPIEDATGAYCPQHGVTLLWHTDEADQTLPIEDEQPA